MSLFNHVLQGQGPGQGSAAIAQLGVEGLARKGGVGQVPNQTPLSKSASTRAMARGFGITHSHPDMIPRRQQSPDPSSTRGHAGALASDRRNPDFPEVLRATSIEHQLRRCHSQPRTATEKSENIVMRSATCSNAADRVGRDRKRSPRSLSRSPSVQSSSRLASPRSTGGRRTSARSPSPVRRPPPRITPNYARSPSPVPPIIMVVPPPMTTPPCFVEATDHYGYALLAENSCTWGKQHAFGAVRGESAMNDPSGDAPLGNGTLGDYYALLKDEKGKPSPSSTPTTCTGGTFSPRCHTASLASFKSSSLTSLNAFFMDNLQSDGMESEYSGGTLHSPSNTTLFAQSVGKNVGEMYEKRLRAMVKEEQKKALKRLK